jgi:PAS domain-containing protein
MKTTSRLNRKVRKDRRKRTEQLLELQTAALEAAENAIVITDREATIVWANTAFQRLTGYTKEEAVGNMGTDGTFPSFCTNMGNGSPVFRQKRATSGHKPVPF